MRRTKIVCTLGPASDTDEIVRELIRAGMDVARLNFSHGDHPTHAARVARVRQLAHAENANVAILADLQGPKIRVGEIAGGAVELRAGARLMLTTRQVVGDVRTVAVDLPTFPAHVAPGQRILLNDGLIELRVESLNQQDVFTQVVAGGQLSSHKGVNVPSGLSDLPALTEKDRADLAFAVERRVDFIALSFVRRATDVIELKRALKDGGADTPVIAKIERVEAMENIAAIIEASDGVMVARGDLGVEAPPEQVPLYQKKIIQRANIAGKPVITATQMLESMIGQPRPTRAEASDVANAILDGTDAVMLSAETAIGKYPVESVQMMARIAETAEANLEFRDHLQSGDAALSVTDAIGNATCEIAMQLAARAIITATFSGFTARMIARHRPPITIFAATSNDATLRRVALVWGVRGTLIKEPATMDEMIAVCIDAAKRAAIVKKGDWVVVTAGAPVRAPGRTNMLQVQKVD
ncbi:MAG: pyruvate kinase [Chloroflexi bacterium]|nr:pyruvate kinase [Chloroflexota bacterium]